MEPGNDFANRRRMDFDLEVITDPATGERKLVYRLNPYRYEIVDDPESPMVIDRLDRFAMPLSEVTRMVEAAVHRMPVGEGQRLGNAHAYIASRGAAIAAMLDGAAQEPHMFVDRSEEYLSSLPDGEHGFAVISLDLVGSTTLAAQLGAERYARVVSVLLHEFSAVVPAFHGHILKFTGDGVLIYFPPPSFVTANDCAMDCALTLRGLVLDAINPVLQGRGYPALNVRIGVESGGAFALTVGHAASRRQRDLVGYVLNMTCKIQSTCAAGEVRVGEVAYRNLHTMWKRGCSLVEPPPNWPYCLGTQPYAIYAFTATGAKLD